MHLRPKLGLRALSLNAVLVFMEPWAAAKKAVPPAPVRVPSQRSLAPSVASVMSIANEMILEAAQIWHLP